ncbi:hypothetical protein AALI21_02745 [Corynebacteriaceae bacterium 6-324]
MVAIDFQELKEKNDALLLAPLNFSVLAGKHGAVEIPESLTDETGILQALPEGYDKVGEIQKAAGVTITPELTLTGPEGYGSRGRRRDLVQTDTTAIEYVAQEQRLINIEHGQGVDVETPVLSNAAEVRFAKRRRRKPKEETLILIGHDAENNFEKDIYLYWIFTRTVITSSNPLTNTDSNILEYQIRHELKDLDYDDPHEPYYFGLAGPGVPEFAAEIGLTLPSSGN